MKVFIDTNVILDVLGKRIPFYNDAAAIWNLAEEQQIEAIVSAVSFTNIFYILRKLLLYGDYPMLLSHRKPQLPHS